MTEMSSTTTWVSEYDYPNRRVSLTLADPGVVGHHWSGIRKDQLLSDPGGDFDVFVTHRPQREGDLDEGAPVIKIVAALDDLGDIKNAHPDFNIDSIGSLTIWPYKMAGEQFGLAHWVWWVTTEAFPGHPRPWAEALRDG